MAVHGQDDNIGDPGLRRAMIDGLAPGSKRHMLVGTASSAYLSGLGLLPDDVLYRTRKAWQAQALKLATHGRASYVSNAGEIQLNARRRKINRADAALVSLVRARGGAALTTGVGVRAPDDRSSFMLTTLSRLCDLSLWRDGPSRDYVGNGNVMPDWAFAIKSEARASVEGRDKLIVSMRSDTQRPSAEWVSTVRQTATTLELEIVVVTQVERDWVRSLEIAERLGARAMPWRPGDHLAAEVELRQVYRSARLVLSDRLHVLIFAATEGAVPVSMPVEASAKIPRTLDVVGLGDYEVPAKTPVADAVLLLVDLAETAHGVHEAVASARSRTTQIKEKMNDLLLR